MISGKTLDEMAYIYMIVRIPGESDNDLRARVLSLVEKNGVVGRIKIIERMGRNGEESYTIEHEEFSEPEEHGIDFDFMEELKGL